MTPTEFKRIRHNLGLSAQGMARALGVSDGRTVRRWEAGDRDIPGPAIRLMHLLKRGKITPQDLTYDLAIKNRDIVAAKMTPADVSKAQRLAREWKPKQGRFVFTPMKK